MYPFAPFYSLLLRFDSFWTLLSIFHPVPPFPPFHPFFKMLFVTSHSCSPVFSFLLALLILILLTPLILLTSPPLTPPPNCCHNNEKKSRLQENSPQTRHQRIFFARHTRMQLPSLNPHSLNNLSVHTIVYSVLICANKKNYTRWRRKCVALQSSRKKT